MHAGIRLHQTVEPGDHGGLYKLGREQAAAAGAMTADEIVLKLEQVPVANLILGHGSEAGIDAIDQFVRRKFRQEAKVLRHIFECRSIKRKIRLLAEKDGKIG